jgi:hypothetical protein
MTYISDWMVAKLGQHFASNLTNYTRLEWTSLGFWNPVISGIQGVNSLEKTRSLERIRLKLVSSAKLRGNENGYSVL